MSKFPKNMQNMVKNTSFGQHFTPTDEVFLYLKSKLIDPLSQLKLDTLNDRNCVGGVMGNPSYSVVENGYLPEGNFDDHLVHKYENYVNGEEFLQISLDSFKTEKSVKVVGRMHVKKGSDTLLVVLGSVHNWDDKSYEIREVLAHVAHQECEDRIKGSDGYCYDSAVDFDAQDKGVSDRVQILWNGHKSESYDIQQGKGKEILRKLGIKI